MKTAATSSSPLITSDSLESSIMGMDAQGMDLATYFMRDKIYSNKKLAVVREYICNAIDEHKKFQIEKPIEAGLRNQGLEKQFYVRDFAKGLDEQSVRNIFGMYFRSTKSDSNQGIGGFGVGSKAAHCYTDSFNVVSWHKGKKTTYVCSLGGGDNGVPVGHIVKMDECDDNQSGIEIQVNIQRCDENDFVHHMETFQAFALHPIELNFYGKKTISPKTERSCVLNDVSFRLINTTNIPHYEGSVRLQMGGVSYGSIDLPKGAYVKKHHALAVDVPIGAMSIPISRESFEHNKQNTAYREKVSELLATLVDKDAQPFRNKKFFDVIKDCVDNMGLSSGFAGDWFDLTIKSIYPDCASFLTRLTRVGVKDWSNLQKNNNKIVVIEIPDKKSSDYWFHKVREHCLEEGLAYLCVGEQYINKNCPILQKEIHFIQAKSLKYKRETSSDFIFTAYRNGSSMGRMSLLEFHNRVREWFNLPKAQTLEEAAEQNKESFDNCKTTNDFDKFTINHPRQRYGAFRVNAFKAIVELKKIGIYCWIDSCIKEKHKKVSDDLEKNFAIQDKIRQAKELSRKFDLKNANRYEKFRNAERILNKFNSIKNEQSLRGKLISMVHGGYSNSLERQELRQLLTISCK